jgi:hypothetical protein
VKVVAPEHLRAEANRLAALLADARGAEILAGLQRLAAALRDPEPVLPGGGCGAAGLPAGPGDVAIWHAERVPGGTELRRRGVDGINPWHWADIDYVPPPHGARRVVLIGESVARGWAYDPMISPFMVLSRQLDKLAPGGFQCVDLAQAGATAEDLIRLIRQLPALEPDVVVVFAGNNWGCMPESTTLEFLADSVSAVREGGYPQMRRNFIRSVIMPRARQVRDELLRLHAACGTQVVVVLPEFNLQGWAPPPGIDLPVIPAAAFAAWHQLRADAERARGQGRWQEVLTAARQMVALDDGTSPVPGQLIGQAGVALGDGAAARAGLEASRDALTGLGITNTPRTTSGIRELLAAFAREHGFALVDMGAAVATAEFPQLPDARYFFDYCHLTDEGMELVMSRVAEAVAGVPAQTVRPGPGIEPPVRAFMHVISAAHGAFHGQRAAFVRTHLRLAAAACPDAAVAMTWLLDVLEGAGPIWARPAIEHLAGLGPGSALLGPVLLSRSMPPELWTLRACLAEVLGRAAADAPAGGDLLAAPFGDGFRPPNLSQGRAFYQATAHRSVFSFAARGVADAALSLCYRMPAPARSAATVTVNGQDIGMIPPSPRWATASVGCPSAVILPGVNQLSIRWPVPQVTAGDRQARDASAMARGEFPYVLPVYGELFEASLALGT